MNDSASTPAGDGAAAGRDWLSARQWLTPRRKRFWLLVALAVYALLGFLLVPWLLRTQGEARLSGLLERPFTIRSAAFNPFLLRAELGGVTLTEPDGAPVAGLDRLVVDFELSSLFRWALTFGEVRIEALAVHVERAADGTLNLTRLVDSLSGGASAEGDPAPPVEPDPPAEGPPRVLVQEFALVGGTVSYRDLAVTPVFETDVETADILLHDLSTLPEREGDQEVVIALADGPRLSWIGEFQVRPLRSTGTVEVAGPLLPLLSRYLGGNSPVRAPSGDLQLDLAYLFEFAPGVGPSLRLDGVDVALRDVALERLDEPLLELSAISARGGLVEYPQRRVSFDRLQIDAPVTRLWRSADGLLGLAADGDEGVNDADGTDGVAPASADLLAAEEAAGAPADTADDGGPPAADADDGWAVDLTQLQLADGRIEFDDRTLREPGPMVLAPLRLDLAGFSTGAEAPARLSLSAGLGDGGRLQAEGDLRLLPAPAAELALTLDDLALSAIEPYLREVIQLDLHSGTLAGALDVAVRDDGALEVGGNLSVAELALLEAGQSEPLLGWRRLDLESLAFASSSGRLELATVRLEAPELRLIINEDQSTNITSLLVAADDEPPSGDEASSAEDGVPASGAETSAVAATDDEAGAAGPPLVVAVDEFQVLEGRVDFSDLALPLPFRTSITGFGGESRSLSTASREPAELAFEGQVADYGLARLEGEVLVADPLAFSELAMVFRNVKMPDLSPYTIRFAGREVADGRLDLDLRYRIEQAQLEASNRLLLSDFVLGKEVPHPDALELPLGMAVALLKGPDGRIDLSVPVKGDLADPQFALGPVIAGAIGNVIGRLVTAPFRLLGSLVGARGEELERLRWEPGRGRLTAPEQETLDKLAEALALRPQLRLTLAGVYHPDADGRALRAGRLRELIDARLTGIEGDGGATGAAARRQALEALAAERLPELDLDTVAAAHQRPASGDDADGATVLDQPAYLAALRDRLASTITLAPDALEELAQARTLSLVSRLEADGIDRERLRLEPPREGRLDGDQVVMKLTLEAARS